MIPHLSNLVPAFQCTSRCRLHFNLARCSTQTMASQTHRLCHKQIHCSLYYGVKCSNLKESVKLSKNGESGHYYKLMIM